MSETNGTRYQIYALVDPRTNLPFYVGQTTDLDERYSEHIQESRSNIHTNLGKDTHIADILRGHQWPEMVVLQKNVKPENNFWRERYWINKLYALGCPLTNSEVTLFVRKPHRVTDLKRQSTSKIQSRLNEDASSDLPSWWSLDLDDLD